MNKARGLRVAKLSQVAAILGEHEEDLAGFLSSDERGRMIPSYLSRLAEVMTRDRETMLEELVRLGASVHHLTEVVRVQQSNSSFGSVKAEVSLEETVREALRIIIPARESAFDTRLEVEEGLTAVLDKHNLLLILANLLSNAKHSLREQHPQGGGLLTIRGRGVAETAILEVEDDGVGIPPANLDRIFNHGFTTRPRGHGFGLHSSANAATELGGGLTVRSPGPGKGATFTLRIPCSTQAEVQLT